MKTTRFADHERRYAERPMWDGLVIEGATSMVALAKLRQKQRARDPSTFPLFTLDDPHQAGYTSMHVSMQMHLDRLPEGFDTAGIPADCFETDGLYKGEFNTMAEFPILRANYMNAVEDATLDELADCAPFLAGGNEQFFAHLNQRPDTLFTLPWAQPTALTLMTLVPARHSYEALAALPNGYFVDDMTPRQMFALARHLERAHGYETFGVGAAIVGFIRSKRPTPAEAAAIAADLAPIFDQPDWPVSTEPVLQDMAASGHLLFLPYSGGMDWGHYLDTGMVVPG